MKDSYKIYVDVSLQIRHEPEEIAKAFDVEVDFKITRGLQSSVGYRVNYIAKKAIRPVADEIRNIVFYMYENG